MYNNTSVANPPTHRPERRQFDPRANISRQSKIQLGFRNQLSPSDTRRGLAGDIFGSIHVCFVYLFWVLVPHHHPRYLLTRQYIRYCDGYLDQQWLLEPNNSSNFTWSQAISLYPVLSINSVTRRNSSQFWNVTTQTGELLGMVMTVT